VPLTEVVSLDEVKAELNIPSSNTDDDTELSGYIDAATTIIEFLCGPVVPAEYTETHDGGSPVIFLKRRPVLSVATVTEYTPTAYPLTEEPLGGSYTTYGYRMDAEKGTLLRTSAAIPTRFAPGVQNVTVTYTAGRAAVPANIRGAALELVRTQWQPQQSGNLPGIDVDNEPGKNVLGYYVPYRVTEMLGPSAQVTVM